MKKLTYLLLLLTLGQGSISAQFQSISGPKGGEVIDVVFVKDTIYTLTSASLYYSINEGDSWSLVQGSNNLPSQLTHVSIDDGIIYLGVNLRNYIFKSETFGQSWTQINDDDFYRRQSIEGFESLNDTLYIYSQNEIYISPDRGETFSVIEHLPQSLPFLLVHNRIVHFEGYHYYFTPDRKLIRTKNFSDLEVLFDLNSDYIYRLYRNESTLFLLESENSFSTLYKLENNEIVVVEENLTLANVNLSDGKPILYDGEIVYEKYSPKYSTDGWFNTKYILLQDNPNSRWRTKLVKIHKGNVYYNWGNLFYKMNLMDSSRVNITNNMAGTINQSIFKSASRIVSGSNPINYYDLLENEWNNLSDIDGRVFILNDTVLLEEIANRSRDSIYLRTNSGKVYGKLLPRGPISFNDDIIGINNLIFAAYLHDSLYISKSFGESWQSISGESGLGRLNVNSSNKFLLKARSGSTWYSTEDTINYTKYEINSNVRYVSIDENDNIYFANGGTINKYNSALDTTELISLPFNINTHFSFNTICFEHYKNAFFVGGIGEGLFVSFDEGENWKTFNEGLESMNVSSIEIDNEYVYVGTYGHIYKRPLDDLEAVSISGVVFEDINENGSKDSNEGLLKNIRVRTTLNNIIAPTNDQGQFSLITDNILDNKLEVITPLYATSSTEAVLIDTISSQVQFGLSFDKEANDVGIKILNPFVFRPGFTNQIDLYLENFSINDQILSLDLELDEKLSLINSTFAPYTLNGNSLTYDDISLLGRETKIISLIFKTDVNATIGDLVNLISTINLKNQVDVNLENNLYQLIDTIRGSFDPNDKSVQPSTSIVYNEQLSDQELLYTIRFQNTGNYPAEFVILRDTLEDNLDLNSIDVLSYSHTCEWKIKEGRVLEVVFPNINLPDSTSNKELSQGFVVFKLNLSDNLISGASIKNKASIYFDFNKPIVTETVRTNIVEPTAIKTNVQTSFTIMPNPTNDYIILKDIPFSKANFEIFDLSGNLLSKGKVNALEELKISINHLTSGQYIILLQDNLSMKMYSSSFVKI